MKFFLRLYIGTKFIQTEQGMQLMKNWFICNCLTMSSIFYSLLQQIEKECLEILHVCLPFPCEMMHNFKSVLHFCFCVWYILCLFLKVIHSTAEFRRDIMLMFQNALMYNRSEHDVWVFFLSGRSTLWISININPIIKSFI